MTVELERSYVFSYESIPHILKFLNTETVNQPIAIVDDYLTPHLRIRKTNTGITLTRKTGDKSSGKRIEEEHVIDRHTAAILASDSKLRIVKKRHTIRNASSDFNITLDIIEKPMKIAILEIEANNSMVPPTIREVFGVDLHECPLAAWDFFRQKIGICGAPSSGKTETAKELSNLLNTRLGANSVNVLEYATSFIQKYNRHPNAMDQFLIWYSQRSREENASSKADIIISDCPTFLAYIYMLFHNKDKMDAQFRIHLVKLYKRVLEDMNGYSRMIYLRPRGLVENNIRFQDRGEICDIADRIHSFLKWHSIPHTVADQGDASRILDSIFFVNRIKKERWKQ